MAAWIEGCGAPVELPQADASLRELYQRAATSRPAATLSRPLEFSPIPERLRELDQHLQQDFAVLPNPRLVLYVHPHFSASGDPVPGYATWFTVFEQALILEPQP